MILINMILDEKVDVVIVGAGPVGMLSAINLAKNGVRVRVLERNEQKSPFSKAIAIHSGTLEYFDAIIPDLIPSFLKHGKQVRAINLFGKKEVSLADIPSKFNFILSLEQWETEKLLEDYLLSLNVKIEKSSNVVSVEQEKEEVTVKLENNNTIKAKYLIDCSGAHSIIRKDVLKLSFKGEKYLGRIYMGDVKINSDLNQMQAHFFGGKNGALICIPLNEERYFRVILIPNFEVRLSESFSVKDFIKLLNKVEPAISFNEENKWITNFEVSRRMASSLKVGRIFLAGDAAHVHSPAGGQGMNLGMQDAFNISSKLKRVLIDKEPEDILTLYEKQRIPIINQVLMLTDSMMKSVVIPSFFHNIKLFILKHVMLPIVLNSKFVRKQIFKVITQLNSARKEIKRCKN